MGVSLSRGGVAMARCSRALMLLCVVYAIVLVLFHQSLSPSSSSTAVDDRKIPVMVRDNDPAEDDAANDTIRWVRSGKRFSSDPHFCSLFFRSYSLVL